MVFVKVGHFLAFVLIGLSLDQPVSALGALEGEWLDTVPTGSVV